MVNPAQKAAGAKTKRHQPRQRGQQLPLLSTFQVRARAEPLHTPRPLLGAATVRPLLYGKETEAQLLACSHTGEPWDQPVGVSNSWRLCYMPLVHCYPDFQ